MRFACGIIEATNTHSEYVILIAFALQQWLQEGASVLRNAYIHTHIHKYTYNTYIHKYIHTYVRTYICTLDINPTFTAMVTGQGKTRSYLHRFKIAERETRPCNEEARTTDHLLYKCKLTQTQRDLLRETVSKSGSWPVSKVDLVTKYLKPFLIFTKTLNFEKL